MKRLRSHKTESKVAKNVSLLTTKTLNINTHHMTDAQTIISLSPDWFQSRIDVSGIALVGSYARGAARSDSDIDLVILCAAPRAYRTDEGWPSELPWGRLGLSVSSFRDHDYGKLWSRHVLLSSGVKVEYGFASEEWACINPVDAGTYQVMNARHRILYDRDGKLRELSEHILSREVKYARLNSERSGGDNG